MRSPIRWMSVLLWTSMVAGNAAAQEWYFSNAAGMALEPALSQLVALRSKYCLEVGTASLAELPEPLGQYYTPSYRIELHILYEDGKELRRQWIFKDAKRTTRLVASLVADVPQDATETGEPETPTGFIEIYDENNLITEEHQRYPDNTEQIIVYFYNNMVLIRMETRLKTPVSRSEPTEPVLEDSSRITTITTDYYRYTRSNTLRSIERVYHQAVSEEARLTRLPFPPLRLHALVNENFVSPGTAYSSTFMQDVLSSSSNKPGDRVVYTTDERGRVLTETRWDEAGTILSEIRNTWTGDRLASVDWKSGDDERRTEYEYDHQGDRIIERDYNRGVLERVVRQEQAREVESLYMNGEEILRAIWENGRKISEEQVRPIKY
ncbi:MAG: hypothetical protein LBT13_01280 [Treponema sp.]|nr:hypothetical protein [Treponema sp.]